MLAIEAATFSGYGGLRQTESPRPQAAEGHGAGGASRPLRSCRWIT